MSSLKPLYIKDLVNYGLLTKRIFKREIVLDNTVRAQSTISITLFVTEELVVIITVSLMQKSLSPH